MSPIYDQISQNRRRTVILITVFVLLIAAIGWAYGEYTGYGPGLVLPAALLALVMTGFSWFAGDSVALAAAGAEGPIERAQAPELYRLVENLSIASGLPTPKIYVIRDDAINAFATGRSPKAASIAVTTGAIQKLERVELEGVVAHELSHVRNLDIRYMMLVAVLVGVIVILSDWMRRSMFWGGRRRDDREGGNAIVLVFAIAAAIIAPIMAELIRLAVSRQREYLADASGALLTRYPEGLAGALEKIRASNEPLERANKGTAHLYFANPFGDMRSKIVDLFSTHPPIEDRIARLRAMASLDSR